MTMKNYQKPELKMPQMPALKYQKLEKMKRRKYWKKTETMSELCQIHRWKYHQTRNYLFAAIQMELDSQMAQVQKDCYLCCSAARIRIETSRTGLMTARKLLKYFHILINKQFIKVTITLIMTTTKQIAPTQVARLVS